MDEEEVEEEPMEVDLPGSPYHSSAGEEPGPIPEVGVNYNDMDVILRNIPRGHAE